MTSFLMVFLSIPLSWSLIFATVSLLVWILLLCLGGVPMNLSLAVKPRSLRLWQKLEILWSQPFVMDAAAFGSSDWSLNLTQTPYSATQKIENCGCFWAPLNNSHQIRPLGVAQMSAVPGQKPWLIKPNYKTKTSSAGPITRMNATDH